MQIERRKRKDWKKRDGTRWEDIQRSKKNGWQDEEEKGKGEMMWKDETGWEDAVEDMMEGMLEEQTKPDKEGEGSDKGQGQEDRG